MNNYEPFGNEWQKEMMKFPKKELVKTVAMFLQEKEAELDTLKSFVRSLNSLAFEGWHGRCFDDMFAIMDAKGDGVGVGKDAYQAWKEFVENENQ